MAKTRIALLAGIGASTHKVMSMEALRAACSKAGLLEVRTVLATGNVIFETALSDAATRKVLEAIVADHGLDNSVFLRSPAQLRAVRDANPFADAARERPNHLLVHFMSEAAEATALADYDGPERIAVRGREVYIDYVDGVGQSRLTSPRLLRGLGHPGTARNWNTLGTLIARSGV